MIGGILLLAIGLFGITFLFGYGKPERLIKFVISLIFGPLLLGLFYNEWLSLYSKLPFLGKVGLLTALPFVLLFALRVMFPGARGVSIAVDLLWALLIFLLTFPARLLWRSGTHFTDRERTRIRLQRNRPVVGGRPPLARAQRPPERPWEH